MAPSRLLKNSLMPRLLGVFALLAGLLTPGLLFAQGKLSSGQVIVVRYYAGDTLVKTLTVTPEGQALWDVKAKGMTGKINAARAFLVRGKTEIPIGGGGASSYSSREYRIGPEDVLDINVWNNQQLSKVVPVRPDGKISLPLLDDVPAAGLTAAELKDRLSNGLKRYIGNPKVTVTVTTINSYKVFIQGYVARPGAYPISGRSTITHAISLAGGFSEFADQNRIIVLRTTETGTEKIKVKYKRIIAGKDPDLRLLPGDTIIVP